jgi:hypothetical protein
MKRFILEANNFLLKEIHSFYHTDYLGYRCEGNPDFLNVLKNTNDSYSKKSLENAVSQLDPIFKDIFDIAYTHNEFKFDWPLTICIVPRSKITYNKNQLLFRSAIIDFISEIVNDLNRAQYHQIFEDGSDYLTRTSNLYTTNAPSNNPNYLNFGEIPYVGITKATCKISEKIKGKSILLIDDVYTKNTNIVEDTIQSLLDAGAKSVLFYAVGKTLN